MREDALGKLSNLLSSWSRSDLFTQARVTVNKTLLAYQFVGHVGGALFQTAMLRSRSVLFANEGHGGVARLF